MIERVDTAVSPKGLELELTGREGLPGLMPFL
jgi:hypothetical protein